MKKKVLVGITIFLLVAIFAFSIVLADEVQTPIQPRTPIEPRDTETVDEGVPVVINDAIPVDENAIMNEIVLNAKEISEDNYAKFQEEITLGEKIINGNTFLMANVVNLNDITINGDVFILADKLNVSKDAALNGNVFIVAINAKIDGKIARELYAACKDLVFEENAVVMYSANVTSDHIATKGMFYRNFNTVVTNFDINEGTTILGDLNYSSDKKANINDNAYINNINFSQIVEEQETVWDIVEEKVLDFSKYFALTMVVFIIMLKFLPNAIEKSEKNFGVSSFGLGILSLIFIPIVLIALLFFRVFGSVILAGVVLFVLTLLISNAVVNIALAKMLTEKKPKIQLPIAVPLVTTLTWIVYQIPFIGTLVAFIWLTMGLGISIKNCFNKKEKK